MCRGRASFIHGPPSRTARRTRRGVLLVPRPLSASGLTAPGTRPPRSHSPMMMVQALTSPISFERHPFRGARAGTPAGGGREGAGPGFPRPLGCCVWPAMSLSRRVPAPARSCRSDRPPGPSGRRCAPPSQPGQRPQAGACAGAGARAPEPRRWGPGGGRKTGRQPPPLTFLGRNSPSPVALPVPSRAWKEGEDLGQT